MKNDYHDLIAGNPFHFADGNGHAYSVSELVKLSELLRSGSHSGNIAERHLMDGDFERWLNYAQRGRFAEFAIATRHFAAASNADRLDLFLSLCRAEQSPVSSIRKFCSWLWQRKWKLLLLLIGVTAICFFNWKTKLTTPLWRYLLTCASLFLIGLGLLPFACEGLPLWFRPHADTNFNSEASFEKRQGEASLPPFSVANFLKKFSDDFSDLHTWHAYVLGLIGVVFTGVGLWVAWQESQLHEQQERVATENLVFSVNKQFEEVFDLPFRRRFYRVYNLLNCTDTNYISDLDKARLNQDLANETNVLRADEQFITDTNVDGSLKHKGINLLIMPDLMLMRSNLKDGETNGYSAAEIQTEISNYRSVLLKGLNMLDSLAILHKIARMDETDPMLLEVYWYSVTNRGTHLMTFITALDETDPGRPPAYPTLLEEMGYHKKQK